MRDKLATVRRSATLWIALALFTSSGAAAQTPPADPAAAGTQSSLVGNAEFARMVQGRKVIVTTRDGRQYDGVFKVSGPNLDSTGNGAAFSVPLSQIARVEKPTYRMRKYSLGLLAAGAGIGMAVACSVDDYCLEEGTMFLNGVMWGGIGAAAGGIIGASLNKAHRHDDILFDSNRSTRTISLAPILSPTRKGLAFSMTWR